MNKLRDIRSSYNTNMTQGYLGNQAPVKLPMVITDKRHPPGMIEMIIAITMVLLMERIPKMTLIEQAL